MICIWFTSLFIGTSAFSLALVVNNERTTNCECTQKLESAHRDWGGRTEYVSAHRSWGRCRENYEAHGELTVAQLMLCGISLFVCLCAARH